MMSLVKTLSQS